MIRLPISRQDKCVFCAALGASLLLLASGLFLGTLGIDDELSSSAPYFDGIGRGLALQQLVTYVLPGPMGVSFFPMVVGAVLYAGSICIAIRLWKIDDLPVAIGSACVVGCFPYFASMMTFDVVQIAYPLGLLLITCSCIPAVTECRKAWILAGGIAFAASFSCYQGVAATYATTFASIVGMRLCCSPDKRDILRRFATRYLPRAVVTAVFGATVYLGADKVLKSALAFKEWSGPYQVRLDFLFVNPGRWSATVDNVVGLLIGRSGDLPVGAVLLFAVCMVALSFATLRTRSLGYGLRVVLLLMLWLAVLVGPFWLLFVQATPQAPRSTVGLGTVYGFVFAALASSARGMARMTMFTVGCLWCFQFVLLGNEMYYCQHLATVADRMTIARLASRIDSVAASAGLDSPVDVVFVGRYSPGGGQYARFDTIGSSPLVWDSGNPYRQWAAMQMAGVDGINPLFDAAVRDRLVKYVTDHAVAGWPSRQSVFVFEGRIVAVNFGL